MNKKWTLHVENFAKIKSADVTIAPLMCFVGDNNSGKSYLMSILWGILTLGKDIGLVMAKGVIFGVISVVTVFPAILLTFDNLIEKTSHKVILHTYIFLMENG